VLESRRQGRPSVGVQHGFIYRDWLNYLHEPDEMQPSAGNPVDRGFPRPDCTIVFDGFAARHLERHGNFPPRALAICGSPRLDAFAATAERMTADDTARLRAEAHVTAGQHLVLVAAKHVQLGAAFRQLVDITASRRDVRLVVKPHPGEATGPYQRDAAGANHVTLLPASADLAAFTAIARVLVTANSTAAIEAMIADVPALVVALPSNLSPFVEAGAMVGAGPDTLPVELDRLLYDGESRSRLKAARRAFLERYGIRADGRAAARSAETILRAARNPE
jgi:UDP-N-acetylglucosamine 2-epimerase